MRIIKIPDELLELDKIVEPYINKMGELSEDAPPEVKAAHEQMKQIVKEMQGY